MTNTDLTGKNKVLSSSKKKSGSLDIKNITISFGKGSDKVTAVENINLSIEAGSFICILGPSGCGKSTLLNSIAGFVKPTSGNIYLDSKEVNEPGPDRGMVFQQYSLLPWKTTFENILLGPRLAGDLEATEISERLLSMVGLSKYRDHYPSQLSGGMQQRVGIARALATQPGVLLMDEPFGALDAQTRNFMQENLLQVWSETGTTVVFVTHDVDESIFLSDKIIVMGSNPGQIISQFDNELPRPREQELSTSKEFIELKRKCLDVIRTESNKAFDFQNLN